MKNTIKAFLFPLFSLTVKVFAKMQPNQVKLQLIIAPIWKAQRLRPAPTPDKTISCISTLFIKILDIVANTKKNLKKYISCKRNCYSLYATYQFKLSRFAIFRKHWNVHHGVMVTEDQLLIARNNSPMTGLSLRFTSL